MDFIEVDVEKYIYNDPRNLQRAHQIRQAEAIDTNYSRVRHLLQQSRPHQIYTLGGDCGVELSLISWLNTEYPNEFAVIWFDAHPDMNSMASSPSGRLDGMVLRHLLDGLDVRQQQNFPALRPEQVILAGTRCFDRAEEEYIRERGITGLPCKELETQGSGSIVDILKKRGYEKYYIHIDVDVLDPTDFTYTTCMAANGLNIQTLMRILSELRSNSHAESIGGCLVEITGEIAKDSSSKETMCRLFLELCALGT